MSGQIDGLIDRARIQMEDARALAGVHEARFMERPSENRWSAGEQLEHVALTDAPYLEVIETAIREARIRGVLGEGPFSGGKIGNWFARSMAPPVRRRMKTMKKLHPPPDLTVQQVLSNFDRVRTELIGSLELARGVDLDRTTIRSPFLKLLKMPVWSAYDVLLTHADRHIWLARQIVKDGA